MRVLVKPSIIPVREGPPESQDDIACPAGEHVGQTLHGAACRCRIERNTLTMKTDPQALQMYCKERYTWCPTWRAGKGVVEGMSRTTAQDLLRGELPGDQSGV